MFSFLNQEAERSGKGLSSCAGIRVTSRDQKVLQFLCEMKFAGVTDVYEGFFRGQCNEVKAEPKRWTQERLKGLENQKLVKRMVKHHLKESLFVTTPKGYRICEEVTSGRMLPRPSFGINYNTFEHDWLMIKIRRLLERAGLAKVWISERVLLANPEILDGFNADYYPDGVYETPEGELWAIELEISRKVKKIYREKINRYVKYIRENQSSKSAIKKVHFLVARDAILKIIREETKIFPEYFVVESLSPFLKRFEAKTEKENS